MFAASRWECGKKFWMTRRNKNASIHIWYTYTWKDTGKCATGPSKSGWAFQTGKGKKEAPHDGTARVVFYDTGFDSIYYVVRKRTWNFKSMTSSLVCTSSQEFSKIQVLSRNPEERFRTLCGSPQRHCHVMEMKWSQNLNLVWLLTTCWWLLLLSDLKGAGFLEDLVIPQTDSGFSPARRKPAKPTVGKCSETKFQHSGQGFPEDSGDPWVKYRQPLQQKPHKNDSEMSGLLKAKNQSMRGNGRKQYQDSPTQKKKTMGPTASHPSSRIPWWNGEKKQQQPKLHPRIRIFYCGPL